MKQFYDSGKDQLRANGYAPTPHDDMQLPGGAKISNLSNAEIVNVIEAAGA